ncbi:MAG: helix-turn-helix domain-containing protein [Clostridia bacterium]|nr:helix-turn-helix domain-containing protein [Clostridia bacterium]MBR5366961.1 helix-turn-helix domain-containing protein [Clostridia bacterium]
MNTSRLVKLRKERKLTQAELAKALNVTQSAIGNWELGKREPDYTTLAQIADFYHVTIDYLLGRSDDSEVLSGFYPVKKKKFPVLGKVACGEPIFADEDRETWITASGDIDADFCLVAQGDSMTGAHIDDGDIVFIKQMDVVENGYIAVVLIGDEATIKYIDYRPETSTLILTPANPAFRTQVYQGPELETIRVIGMAVTLQKSLTRRHA